MEVGFVEVVEVEEPQRNHIIYYIIISIIQLTPVSINRFFGQVAMATRTMQSKGAQIRLPSTKVCVKDNKVVFLSFGVD